MATLTMPVPAVLSIREASAYLSCSTDHVARLVKDGRIPAHRLGDRAIRIRVSDIEDYLNRSRVQ
jgi:excisionase family DNA binding protein